ncbi:hypothetical protein [Serratia sp. 14-2641]|uniref:hypothetical protein n=1 Tax=Serratia sp. 14-2641 TaxID=1841657 RepID=UPI0008100E04|nr:hypothetical protein [Serratia sp. 14-2641]OCJ46350.1 hypothetical protein A6U95_01430 [Serratia sp. 14-2641]
MNMSQNLTVNINSMSIQMALGSASHALTSVTAIGFTVIRIDIVQHSRPTLVVQADSNTEQLVKGGKAVLYCHGSDDNGPFKKYQCQMGNCRIVWEER